MAATFNAGGFAITVEQVREQLAQLGHNDVPDSIIAGFLKDLTTEGHQQFAGSATAQMQAGRQDTKRGDTAPQEFTNSRDRTAETTNIPEYTVTHAKATSHLEQRHVDRYNRVSTLETDTYSGSRREHVVEEEDEEEEEDFREQTYAAHGYKLGGQTIEEQIRRRPASAGPQRKPAKATVPYSPLWEDERENYIESPEALGKMVPNLKLDADDLDTHQKAPKRAGALSARQPLTSRNSAAARPASSVTSRSTMSGINPSRCGSIVMTPKPREAKIDRVARYAQMQQSWQRDSFLTGNKKPRPAQNFHAIHAAQHAHAAQATANAKARGAARSSATKSYQAPNEKRRDALRWEVRVRLLNGMDGRVP